MSSEEQPRVLMSGKAGRILNSLHREEPVFILRAKDILSTMSILHYITLIETYNPHNEGIESLTALLEEFRTWQHENPELVRLPD